MEASTDIINRTGAAVTVSNQDAGALIARAAQEAKSSGVSLTLNNVSGDFSGTTIFGSNISNNNNSGGQQGNDPPPTWARKLQETLDDGFEKLQETLNDGFATTTRILENVKKVDKPINETSITTTTKGTGSSGKCQGWKKGGEPCSSHPMKNSSFCRHHQNQAV